MDLFVTGGTGFLGSHFLGAALAAGHRVTALRRPGSKSRIPLEQEPNWCDGNLDDDWSKHLQNHDILVHLAAAGVSAEKNDWEHCFHVNVIQSLCLWRQAVDYGIKNFLICGSCFEYGLTSLEYEYIPADAPLRPMDAYSASKAAATMAALGLANGFGLKLIVVRPFHLFGAGEVSTRFYPSLMRAAKAGEDFPMTKGEQVRDFMRVEDAAFAIVQAIQGLETMSTNVAIQNIGTGHPQSLLDFAQEQWASLNARGSLLPGQLPYRASETMRYVPLL